MSTQLQALKVKLDGNLRYWKTQQQDNQHAREEICKQACVLIEMAKTCIDHAVRIPNEATAGVLVAAATAAIEHATILVREKFPVSPLASIA